eukprot:jgi/Mesen1/9855/ME000070S09140
MAANMNQCTNVGSNGRDVQWRCEADLPAHLTFGHTEVVCEGYESAADARVLEGSCGLEYSLKRIATPAGGARRESSWWRSARPANDMVTPHQQQQQRQKQQGWGWSNWLALGIVLYIAVSVYKTYSTPRGGGGGNFYPRYGPGAGANGGNWFGSSTQPSSSSCSAPGAAAGAGPGLGGHGWGNWGTTAAGFGLGGGGGAQRAARGTGWGGFGETMQRPSPYGQQQRGAESFWGTGRTRGWFGGGGGAAGGPSAWGGSSSSGGGDGGGGEAASRRATGFASTRRR